MRMCRFAVSVPITATSLSNAPTHAKHVEPLVHIILSLQASAFETYALYSHGISYQPKPAGTPRIKSDQRGTKTVRSRKTIHRRERKKEEKREKGGEEESATPLGAGNGLLWPPKGRESLCRSVSSNRTFNRETERRE